MKKFYTTLSFTFLLVVFCKAQWMPQGEGILPVGYGIWDISAVDENVVWAMASNNAAGNPDNVPEIVLKSTNGGDNWEKFQLDELADKGVIGMTAASSEVAWLTAYDVNGTKYFYKTTNGGMSWNEQYIIQGSPNPSWPPALKFIDEDQGYYVDVWAAKSEKTADGGANWSTPSSVPFVGSEGWNMSTTQNWLEVIGDTLMWGTSTHIYRSTDGGENWSKISHSDNWSISSISFDKTGYGLAVSDWNSVTGTADKTFFRKSEDFGASWKSIYYDSLPLNVIQSIPGLDKTFIGVSGVMPWILPNESQMPASVFTTDGGETWVEIDRGIPYHSIDFASCEVGWAGTVGNFDYGPNKPAIFKWIGEIPGCTVSTVNRELQSGMAISPNPASGIINIQIPEPAASPLDVLIFDVQGKLLLQLPLAAGQPLDVADLSSGMYSLIVVVGHRVFAGKFIKQ